MLCLAAASVAVAQPAVSVGVSGKPMRVNGQSEIAAGLMGVHAFKLTEENVETYGIDCIRQIHFSPSSAVSAIKDGEVKPLYEKLALAIDCPGDRYHPPTVLQNQNYKEFFTRIGTEYARKCNEAGWPGWVEFWNEPYLNWASRSHGAGRNVYNPKWYETEGRKHGGKVTIKGWDEPLEHLRWRKYWAEGEDGKIYYGVDIPQGLEVGDTFRGHSPKDWYFTNREEQTFTVVEHWGLEDPTQVGYWSGRQNRDFYLWMFLPFAQAVKSTNPDVTVLAGWDFGLSGGDWAVWRELYKPLLDEGHEYIDGITDHHYGVNSRWVPMWYEVACAYNVTRHGKWIKGYNTECGGKLDPAVYGEAKNVMGTSEGTYALRDIMELLYHAPGKAGSRTAHHPDEGVLNTLKFLKDLRGRLVACDSSDPDIWPVAAINGKKLVLVVFNNARESRQIEMTLTAPEATEFVNSRGGMDHDQQTETVETPGRTMKIAGELPSLQARKVVLDLSAKPSLEPAVTRKQFFASPGPLVDISAGQSKDFTVDVPADQLDGAQKAWLKLSLQNVEDGVVGVELNGQKVDVPSRNFTTLIPVDASRIQQSNTLTFSGGENGYRVCVASLVVERR
ncbi:MAG: hypothetical protein ACOC93_00550 [Planctomycetota bacterium]